MIWRHERATIAIIEGEELRKLVGRGHAAWRCEEGRFAELGGGERWRYATYGGVKGRLRGHFYLIPESEKSGGPAFGPTLGLTPWG